MKKLLLILLMVFLFCFAASLYPYFHKPTPLNTEEWTSEQKEVVECFQSFVRAVIKRDIEKIKSYWHPNSSIWNYTQEHPVSKDVYLKELGDILKSKGTWTRGSVYSFEIKLVDNVAVLYATETNVFNDADGDEIWKKTPWAAVLIKQNDKWLFLSLLSDNWIVK
ncbi:MAG: nuclear transport factor 2 family protein [Promethearchaeota archaeon]|jgi:hypothetical protein